VSVLVIGLSHHSAPIALLEAAALDPTRVDELAGRVRRSDSVSEAVVLATCNRLEVYAEAVTFHGAVAAIGDALAAASGMPLSQLREHLYVHYEDRAVAHAFAVACGLDSMAVGEVQVLGQMRDALRSAQRTGHAGPALNSLFQHSLRVGKRAHSETAIDTVSQSLVEAALACAVETAGPLEQAHVLVVGAGGMSGLAAATAARRGAGRLTVVNRTAPKAQRLAESTGARTRPFADLDSAIAEADIVISCTGAVGHLITVARVAPAASVPMVRPTVFLDLAMPRDVEPGVADLPGARVVGLAELGARLAASSATAALPEVQEVTDLVTGEVADYLVARTATGVAPTVAALRARAADVVTVELARLDLRLPDLGGPARAELQRTVHRVVEKLLHTPTVRIKQLSVDGQGGDYAAALRELFDLDPHDVVSVCVPPDGPALPDRPDDGGRS